MRILRLERFSYFHENLLLVTEGIGMLMKITVNPDTNFFTSMFAPNVLYETFSCPHHWSLLTALNNVFIKSISNDPNSTINIR